MKKYIITTLISIVIAFSAQAQTDQTIQESKFHVDGVCGMCKKRIEDAALRTKGVKLAEWNQSTKELSVTFKNTKVSEVEVKKAISKAGHETDSIPADTSAYKLLPNCCKYKDGIKSH